MKLAVDRALVLCASPNDEKRGEKDRPYCTMWDSTRTLYSRVRLLGGNVIDCHVVNDEVSKQLRFTIINE